MCPAGVCWWIHPAPIPWVPCSSWSCEFRVGAGYQNHFGPVQDAEVRPLVALGMVVRVEQMDSGGFELGVKFQNVYPDDLEALVKFLEATAPPPSI